MVAVPAREYRVNCAFEPDRMPRDGMEVAQVETDKQQRIKERRSRNESVLLELSLANGEEMGRQVVHHTQTLDVSEEGIKLRLGEEVPLMPVSILVIEPLDRAERFRLGGEVRWCERLLDSLYEVGIQITKEASPDYEAWMAYVHEPLQGPVSQGDD